MYFFLGDYFINDFLLTIQIWCKICFAVILLLAIRSLQNFAHTKTAELSWYVQKFVSIMAFESE